MNRTARIAATSLPVVVLAALWLWWSGRPAPVSLSGESESSTATFTLAAHPYALDADLLPGCQYTFYLTPAGQLWNRAGRAVASAAGVSTLSTRTGPLSAGHFYVHGYTAPEEGCSWTLRLRPL